MKCIICGQDHPSELVYKTENICNECFNKLTWKEQNKILKEAREEGLTIYNEGQPKNIPAIFLQIIAWLNIFFGILLAFYLWTANDNNSLGNIHEYSVITGFMVLLISIFSSVFLFVIAGIGNDLFNIRRYLEEKQQ